MLTAILGAGAAITAARRSAAAAMTAITATSWRPAAGSAQSEPSSASSSSGAAASTTSRSSRGSDGRFDNPWETWTGDKRLSEVREFSRQIRELKAPNWGYLTNNRRPTLADMAAAFPLHAPDYSALSSAPDGAVAAIWVGHASVLVRLEGLTVLTDPVLEDRASPVQRLGPKRAVPAAISAEDPTLPRIDAVCISHNHYDHLCYKSVMRLYRRFGDGLTWYVPSGLGRWFHGCGIKNVVELGWWEERQHPGSKVKFVLTPAQHWSGRYVLDMRRSLWGGWAVVGERQRFWFAGDTGYAPVFPEIGARLGPFDLAAVPTGAYQPRDFLGPQHVDPDEAVRIHQEVGARRSMAIHCCTFFLTMEPMDEPPAKLAAAAAERGLQEDEFITLQHGALVVVKDGAIINTPHRLPLTLNSPNAGAAPIVPALTALSSGAPGGPAAAAAAAAAKTAPEQLSTEL